MRLDDTNKFQLALAVPGRSRWGTTTIHQPLHFNERLAEREGGSIRRFINLRRHCAGQLRHRLSIEALSRLPQVEGTGGDATFFGTGTRTEPLRQAGAKRGGGNFISSGLFVLAALESRGTLTTSAEISRCDTANITRAVNRCAEGGVNDQGLGQRQARKIYRRSDRRAEQAKRPGSGRDENSPYHSGTATSY
ncbi:hypothetical protein KCP75_13990 [Salmonella enterica subsp. enterica]|nr:hypothetical protein KCP75_13990 [Salmonella enterica subsp. enterica]